MQIKLDIQEVLEDAKKDWKDKYEKYYYHTPPTITATADARFPIEQKEQPKTNPSNILLSKQRDRIFYRVKLYQRKG